MNKKEHVSVSERDLKKVLDGLGHRRESVADALGITSTTLRKWIKDGRIPKAQWERLKSEEFKKTLAIQKKFGANHYAVPNMDVDDNNILHSKAPPSVGELKEEYDFVGIPTESLVNELENRGWTVTLQKRQS